MPTLDEMRIRQSLPLDCKVAMTQKRILDWVREFGEDHVYVSFSGGKDSTVLLHIARQMFPDMEAVFVDTGLEFPELKKFVRNQYNVKILHPDMNFKQVITTYGYPVISKEVSGSIYEVRNPNYHGKSKRAKLEGQFRTKDGMYSPFNQEKYKPLLYTDFRISNQCCNIMKKRPVKRYDHKYDKYAMLGTMTEESRLRMQSWLKFGCNGFERARPISNPMSIWTEQDVYRYIHKHNIKIAPVYGEVVQIRKSLFQCDLDKCKFCTTGQSRTGCVFCGYGAHLEKGETRFQRLKRTHPRLYDYCIGGGSYNDNGIWVPDKNGLGMAHVFDELNKLYGESFIRYK